MSQQIIEAICQAIKGKLPDADVRCQGGGGHYSVEVVSSAFSGKGTLESHKLVYGAIAPLMAGQSAPVHAIDRLKTACPNDA